MSYVTSNDPVDHLRTSRPLVGQALKSPAKEPGLLLMAAGLAAYGICLTCFAHCRYGAGIIAAGISLVAMAAGGAWLWKEARRVRKLESDWNGGAGVVARSDNRTKLCAPTPSGTV